MLELLVFYALIGLGYLLGLRRRLERAIMVVLLYLLLPLLILQVISRNVQEFLQLLPSSFSLMLSGALVSYILSRYFFSPFEPKKRITLTLTAVWRNALFLPLAVAIALKLPERSLLIIFSFSLAYNVLQPLITPLIVAEYSKKEALRGLKLPTLWAALIAIVLGLLGYPIELPGYEALKIGVSYGSLIYVGLRLSKAPRPQIDLAYVAIIRFFIVPLLLLPLILSISSDKISLYTYIIEVSSAPAVSNVIYAHYFRLDPITASRVVTYLNALGVLIDFLYRTLLIRASIFASSYRLGMWL